MVPLGRAALWAAVSMPRASPATTVCPASPRPAAMPRAIRSPRDEALRAPITATGSRDSQAGSPRSHRTGGAPSISRSAGG